MANRQRDPRKEQFWRRTLRQWQRSGLSIRDFCRQHQLSEPSFYAWRGILAQRDRQQPTPPPPSTSASPSAEPLPLFLPLHIAPRATPTLELLLPDGRLVRVPVGFDAVTLQRLLQALRDASC